MLLRMALGSYDQTLISFCTCFLAWYKSLFCCQSCSQVGSEAALLQNISTPTHSLSRRNKNSQVANLNTSQSKSNPPISYLQSRILASCIHLLYLASSRLLSHALCFCRLSSGDQTTSTTGSCLVLAYSTLFMACSYQSIFMVGKQTTYAR